MNYQKIYNQICERAKIELDIRINNRISKLEYYESHHILPKCMGGSGLTSQWKHDNIVLLTAKEHFLCHRLLCEIYPDNTKLILAVHRLIYSKSSTNKKDIFLSCRFYDYFRKEHIKSITGSGNPMYGKFHTLEAKSKMSEAKKGKPNPHMKGDLNPSKRPEVRSLISESRLGEKNPMKRPEVVNKMKESNRKTIQEKKRLGIPTYKNLICPHCNLEGAANNMSRYHFNNCKKLN